MCRPLARPGSTLPVVPVWPWRTKRTVVGAGSLVRRAGMAGDPTYLCTVRDSLARVTAEVVECRACPRLVAWRELVAVEKRASFATEEYWGRPVPGLGDKDARLLVVGLAPAAHGGNRTGRVFTGDRSGDWLYAALYRAGLANQPTSVSADDGLELIDTRVLAAVRCAPPENKPSTLERDACRPWMLRELQTLKNVKVVVA